MYDKKIHTHTHIYIYIYIYIYITVSAEKRKAPSRFSPAKMRGIQRVSSSHILSNGSASSFHSCEHPPVRVGDIIPITGIPRS